MRGPMVSGSGNQDRRYPEGSSGKAPPFGKGKRKPKRKGKGKRPPFGGGGPLHDAMVNAAT